MSNSNISVGILGLGAFVPEKILDNSMLEKMVDTSDEWIVKRTGIKERRILEDNVLSHTMGSNAAKLAIENAGCKAEDIELIIVSTSTPDYITPNMGSLIQADIGAVNAAAFDISAACSGFIYGLNIAKQFIQNGAYKKILVISCESLSRYVDWQDRATCILFGDGAGAAVVGEVEAGYGILADEIGTDGKMADAITIPSVYFTEKDLEVRLNENKRVLWMDGSSVMKFAVRIMTQSTLSVIEKAGLTINDVSLVIPHQANIRIIEGAAKRLELRDDQLVITVDKYGNTSSSSVILALDDAIKSGRVQKGDNIVLVGFGGGLTWGATLIKWSI